ncbi:PaaI family thioesterase [Mechercharimyces sp. CAU 1602]|uniref:PaaI family thioesterase n=1 Tax=Mechercharimyces sp. CAU 1602 TaxID=2973933 RepID=UPI0021616268|nr:PaaI family thioesterase [Mechercharimyces sp. CAU 1602]MCS1350131.1 PaaI family thioesterase [Mechercharimyces sp. CAU 1602]
MLPTRWVAKSEKVALPSPVRYDNHVEEAWIKKRWDENVMTLEDLRSELQDLTAEETETIHKLVQAMKRTRESPLAYIEEVMHFRSLDFDETKQAYVHQMQVTDELKNRYHILHGGITSTFIDTAMGSTVFQEIGIDRRLVTLDLNIRFLSPGIDGLITAYTNIIKKGNTIIVVETKVVDERDRLIASASGTFYRMG